MKGITIQQKAIWKPRIILIGYSTAVVSFFFYFILQISNYGINYGFKNPVTNFFSYIEYIDFNSYGLNSFFDPFFTIVYLAGLIGLSLPILAVFTKNEFKQFNRIAAISTMSLYLLFTAVFNPITFFYFTYPVLMDEPIIKIILIPEILFSLALIFISLVYKQDYTWKFHKVLFYWGIGSFVFFIFRIVTPVISGFVIFFAELEFWLENLTVLFIMILLVPKIISARRGEIAERVKTEDYEEFKEEVQTTLADTIEHVDWIEEEIPKPEEYKDFRNYGLNEEDKNVKKRKK